jgi:small nuclear ribonucleoprotein (snRNP)-like protein
MVQPGPASFKSKLVGTTVLVKLSLFSRAFSGTVTAADETGFCFSSDAMSGALQEMTGTAMANMAAPTIYLTFANLEWLVFSDTKAAAATA